MSEEKKTGRGGARAGAGRKPAGVNLVTVTYRMPVTAAEKLKRMANVSGVPRWRVLAELIERARV